MLQLLQIVFVFEYLEIKVLHIYICICLVHLCNVVFTLEDFETLVLLEFKCFSGESFELLNQFLEHVF
jgi:hypothetical protein